MTPRQWLNELTSIKLLVTLPIAAGLAPVLTIPVPPVRFPVVARAWRFPATRYPVVASACPVPVTANPDIPNNRWRSYIFDSRRWWRHHDGLAIIRRTAGWHWRYYATGQRSGCQEAGQNNRRLHWVSIDEFLSDLRKLTLLAGISSAHLQKVSGLNFR